MDMKAILLLLLPLPFLFQAMPSSSKEILSYKVRLGEETNPKGIPVILTLSCPPAPSEFKGIRVVSDDGEVPCQWEFREGKVLIAWVPSGNLKDYRIVFEDRPIQYKPRISVKEGNEAIEVGSEEGLITRYVFSYPNKPYFYPLIGPKGQRMTRAYPSEEIPGESRDHRHHRSFWFSHGDVNGVDFWSESPKGGRIVHKKFKGLSSGPVYGLISDECDWISPDGRTVCREFKEVRIYRTDLGIFMDFEIKLRAAEGPIRIGDTKEGTFAIRVADSMTVTGGKGHIENSRGQKDRDAWGKRAEWCDYWGPVGDTIVGIAIMDHPSNYNHPTFWHARDYGLFAANPFGARDFTGDKNADGSVRIEEGKELTFRYRVFIHEGDTGSARIRDVWNAYTSSPILKEG
jgi:hypothetical protein